MTFSSAREYYNYVAEQDLAQLLEQPNSVNNASNVRLYYTSPSTPHPPPAPASQALAQARRLVPMLTRLLTRSSRVSL